jgi:nitroreductase
VIGDLHLEAAVGALRDLVADIAKAQNAELLAGQHRPGGAHRLPSAVPQRGVGMRNAAHHRHQQGHGVIGHRRVVGPGAVGDLDAARSGRRKIDVFVAGAERADDFQNGKPGYLVGVEPGGAVGEHGADAGSVFGDVRGARVRRRRQVELKTGGLEPCQIGRRQFDQNQKLAGHMEGIPGDGGGFGPISRRSGPACKHPVRIAALRSRDRALTIVPSGRRLPRGCGHRVVSSPAHPTMRDLIVTDTIAFLKTRRSVKPREMSGPGPSPAELETILTIGARVPDHGKLAPWRFIVFEGEARARAGAVIAAVFAKKHPGAPAGEIEIEKRRMMEAPLVIAVVSFIKPHPKVPAWEQELSAGASCMNIVSAATALGYGANWLTGWFAFDRDVLDGLGLKPDEKLAGFIHIGKVSQPNEDRPRPALADIVTRF